MKKNAYLFILLALLCSNVFAPLAAQEAVSINDNRTSRRVSQPSLPSWAKGTGFEAAIKWWKAGRDESVLSKKEKRAFNRLKKRVKITAIIVAVLTVLGGGRYMQKRKKEKIITQKLHQKINKIVEATDKAMEGFWFQEFFNVVENALDEGVVGFINKEKFGDDETWSTILHIAAARGKEDLVARLLQHGADPDITDSEGYTPLNTALGWESSKRGSRSEIIKLLVSKMKNIEQLKASLDFAKMHFLSDPAKVIRNRITELERVSE